MVGNDKIGRVDERFLYLSNVNMNAGGASFGYENKYSRPGVNVSRYANPAIGWEKSRITLRYGRSPDGEKSRPGKAAGWFAV